MSVLSMIQARYNNLPYVLGVFESELYYVGSRAVSYSEKKFVPKVFKKKLLDMCKKEVKFRYFYY